MSTAKNKHSAVNHPAHYNKGGIETIEYIRTRCTPEEFKGFLRGNLIKYVDRAPDKKQEEQDYRKARFYLDAMISLLSS